MPAVWEEISAKAQKHRDEQLPVEWRLTGAELAECGDLNVLQFIEARLSAEELEITGSTASQALKKLASGEWSSVQVTSGL